MAQDAAQLSRREFLGLAAGFVGSVIPVAAFADPPRPEGKIAFVTSRDFGYGRGKIWIVLSDGSGRRALTENMNDPGENWPAWSPDGNRIAFSALRNGRFRVYVRDSDGKNEVCLTPDDSLGENYESPTWSPDSTSVAFCIRPADRDQAHIGVASAAGTELRQLTSGHHNDWMCCFSSDGQRIIFETTRDGHRQIYSMNKDGSNPVNLSRHPGMDHHPACAPDGKRIAFMSRRDSQSTEIFVMNSDGSDVVNLTNDPARDSEPAWSPCGNWIAFTRCDAKGGPMHIYTMRADGSECVKLTRSRVGDANFGPSWGR